MSRTAWGCTSCLKECRFEAINFFLGADVGGKGSPTFIQAEGKYQYMDGDGTRTEQLRRLRSTDRNLINIREEYHG